MFNVATCLMLIPTVPKRMLAIIIVLLFLTVVGIPIAIAMIIYTCKTNQGTHLSELRHGERMSYQLIKCGFHGSALQKVKSVSDCLIVYSTTGAWIDVATVL